MFRAFSERTLLIEVDSLQLIFLMISVEGLPLTVFLVFLSYLAEICLLSCDRS